MAAEVVQDIRFGVEGDDADHLGAGWSPAESGFRWMVGEESDLWLSNPGPGDTFVVQMELAPFCHAPEVPSQRMMVLVRGRSVGRSVLTGNLSAAYRIPAELMSGKAPVHIVFRHPGCGTSRRYGHPSDTRQLAAAIRTLRLLRVTGDLSEFHLQGGHGITPVELAAQSGMPAAEFMLQFESLGDNCEFGLVQRRCGAEPLSLLRFSNIGLAELVQAIETEFQGLGDAENLRFWTDESVRREYVLQDRRFALTFHTFLYQGDVDESRLVQQQAARLRLLRRKLLEDLENGEKIFVVKRNDEPPEGGILALFAALNRYGRNTLLWVVEADGKHEAGSVERMAPGLLKGYIDRFAPYDNAHDLSFDLWLRLCSNARRLVSHEPVAA